MSERYIFQIEALTKVYDRKEVLKDIWLAFYPGSKIGVLGSNGSGKSTLMRIMALQDTDFIGTARAEAGISIGYVPQEPKLHEGKTVLENIEEAVAPIRDLLKQQEAIGDAMATATPEEFDALTTKMDKVQTQIDATNAYELDRQLEIAMDAMRLPPPDALVDRLSGGERRRVAMCKMMLQKPDLLLLDEPTNHLDAESVFWLERHLEEYPGTVVAVTHDRYFLDNVAKWILELESGRGYPYEGNYTTFLEKKHSRLKLQEKTESVRQKTLARELEWVRTSPKGRLAKNKARLQSYEKLAAQEYEERDDDILMQIPPGPELGNLVVRAEGISKAYGDNLIFENMTFDLPRGGIVGVIGPNGAGKTTLFRMIVGQEKPDTGTLKVGDTVKVAYVDQSRDTLNPDSTVFEEITGGTDYIMLGKRKIASRGYVSRFNFRGPDQQKRVGDCSGGERNRVHLAKVLRSGGNLLLLDEPTNDLDVDTLRSLEEAISSFGGCAVVISHDRWFLDRVATHILAFENESKTVFFEGNYQAYEENRRARLGHDADQPHRMKYKKLKH